MAGAVTALDFLANASKHANTAIIVLFGEEAFLKRQVVDALRREVLTGGDAEFSQTVFDGAATELRDVLDELSTVSLFGAGRRLIVVEEADDFVSRHRAALEDYVAKPSKNGVLVLELAAFASNTRLYKAVVAGGLAIEATAPPTARLQKWVASWSQERYGRKLDQAAAELLVELVGPELGLLDQELAKLNAAQADGIAISAAEVEQLVGGWRVKTTWEMLDAAVAGDAVTALVELDRLLMAGENAIGLLAQVAGTLRRFAAATRIVEQAQAANRRINLRQALEEAGFRSFVLGKAETQLRQLGRVRGSKLYRWLIETDLALKGDSQAPPRMVLEQLIARLSRQAAPEAETAGRMRPR
jgi:DNA polymerase-3 subunit delta